MIDIRGAAADWGWEDALEVDTREVAADGGQDEALDGEVLEVVILGMGMLMRGATDAEVRGGNGSSEEGSTLDGEDSVRSIEVGTS